MGGRGSDSIIERIVQGAQALERAATQSLVCEHAEPDSDLIEPTTAFGSKDEANAKMVSEPATRVIIGPGADVISDDHYRTMPHPLEYLVEEGQHPGYGAAGSSPA